MEPMTPDLFHATRMALRMSQAELAEQLGYGRETISQIENGRIRISRRAERGILNLAAAEGVDVADLNVTPQG